MLKERATTPAWVIRVIAGLFVAVILSAGTFILCQVLRDNSYNDLVDGKLSVSQQNNLLSTLDMTRVIVIVSLVALWLMYAVVEFSLHKR